MKKSYKIIITGCNGFIGQSVVQDFLQRTDSILGIGQKKKIGN